MNRPTEENSSSWKDLSEECKVEILSLYPDIPDECYANCSIYYKDGEWWLTLSDFSDIFYSGSNWS
jgi:hypothetical protein